MTEKVDRVKYKKKDKVRRSTKIVTVIVVSEEEKETKKLKEKKIIKDKEKWRIEYNQEDGILIDVSLIDRYEIDKSEWRESEWEAQKIGDFPYRNR